MKILNNMFADTKVEKKPINKALNFSEDKINKTYTKEEDKIRNLFKKYNKVITNESIKEIKIFINKTEGSFESKLKTIETALTKDLDLTSENLTLVHKALNGDLDDIVEKLILKSNDIKKIYKKLPREIKKLVDKKVKEGLSLKEAIFSLSKSVLIKLFNNSEDEELFSFTQKKLEISKSVDILDVLKATDKTEEKKSNKLENKQVKTDIKEVSNKPSLEKVIENSLDALEENIDSLIESINGEIEFENIQLNVPEVSFKKIIRTEISEKMIILKKEFNDYKKYITNKLDNILESKVKTVDIKKT